MPDTEAVRSEGLIEFLDKNEDKKLRHLQVPADVRIGAWRVLANFFEPRKDTQIIRKGFQETEGDEHFGDRILDGLIMSVEDRETFGKLGYFLESIFYMEQLMQDPGHS